MKKSGLDASDEEIQNIISQADINGNGSIELWEVSQKHPKL
jgi:Ca2+-binding EF-hand superfamily protein